MVERVIFKRGYLDTAFLEEGRLCFINVWEGWYSKKNKLFTYRIESDNFMKKEETVDNKLFTYRIERGGREK